MPSIRVFVRNFALATQKSRQDPRIEYEFVPATEKDLKQIVDLCCSDFIKIEPNSRALGFKEDETRCLFEWIIGKALHYPYSLKVYHRATGDFIGIRTLSEGNRDPSLDWEPFNFEAKKLPMNVQKLASVLDESKKNFWQIVDPSVKKVIRREISFICADHQRKGIAKTMVELNLDFDQLRTNGIHGIVSEASSIANQTLLAKKGYKCIYTPKVEWENKIDDGTTTIKVFFKDIRHTNI